MSVRRRARRGRWLAGLGLFAVLGSVEAQDCPIRFVEIAAAAGIDFVHASGATAAKHLPETMGSGVAWIDADGDGWQDLYWVQSGRFPPAGGSEATNHLYRNNGDGTFSDRTLAAGVGDLGYGQGATAADVDGDGASDLMITNYGPDRLYLANGDGTFRRSPVAFNGLWSSSAAFADLDGDDDLDLYVTSYLDYDPAHGIFCGDPETGKRRYCDPSLFAGAADRVFRNLGDGRFDEVTAEWGFAGADGRGLGVLAADLDGDGLVDLYVANDLTLNLLYGNRWPEPFEDLSLLSGAAVNRQGKPEAGMGVALGDIDGDLDADLAVTNFDVETNTLYRNLGGLTFSDESAVRGFGVPSFNFLAFGLLLEDFDRDGSLDAFVANGHIFPEPRRENVRYRQRDQVLAGDRSTASFDELLCTGVEVQVGVSRGAAAGDFDNDGDVDVAVQQSDGPALLWRNDSPPRAWLGVELRSSSANRNGVGARLVLATAAGEQARWVLAGDSYQSSSDPRRTFAARDPKELRIEWPSGRRMVLGSPPANHYLRVYESGR